MLAHWIRTQTVRLLNICRFLTTRGATPVEPKAISTTEPAARCTAATDGPAVYAYSDNCVIDLKHAVIVDVEATTAACQAEVGAAKTMIDRTFDQLDVRSFRVKIVLTYDPHPKSQPKPDRLHFRKVFACGRRHPWAPSLNP
jgi:hypothetical protein